MSEEVTVIGKECKFAIHMPTRASDIPDFHLIKERVFYSNGTNKPNVKFVKNYKRSFGVTRPQYRNHQQKKEYETIDKLTIHECTQSELRNRVAHALEQGYSPLPLRQLAASPYLYGTDVSSTSLIKYDYAKRFPDAVSTYSVAFFDIETDVVHGTNDPTIATVVYEANIYTYVTKDFVKGYAGVIDTLNAKFKENLEPYLKKANESLKSHKLEEYMDGFQVHFFIEENCVDVMKNAIAKVHELSPDFLAIWNMDFDIPRILETLEKYNVDPANVFSHPGLPPELRFCKYKKGSTKKVTASGQVKPKNPSEQWHSLYCPAGFYIIDAMCSYRFIRQGSQEMQSYSLNFILGEELELAKLRCPAVEGIVEEDTLDWHYLMQSRFPLDYVIYNIFDCLGMFFLERKNNDLAMALPVNAEFTDFARYNSQTKRMADDYHFFLAEQGKLIGTIAPPPPESKGIEEVDGFEESSDEEEVVQTDDEVFAAQSDVLSLRNWIVTLPSHLTILGRKVLKKFKSILSLIRCFVYDVDAVSAYPSCTAVANVSRETTVKEVIDIQGIDEALFRRHNINLLQGHVNAIEYATEMHGLPKPQDALKLFEDMK